MFTIFECNIWSNYCVVFDLPVDLWLAINQDLNYLKTYQIMVYSKSRGNWRRSQARTDFLQHLSRLSDQATRLQPQSPYNQGQGVEKIFRGGGEIFFNFYLKRTLSYFGGGKDFFHQISPKICNIIQIFSLYKQIFSNF